MYKKGLIYSIVLFIISILIDLILKINFISSGTGQINRGFIFGTLQDLPASLTLVTLCSIGGLLVFVFFILIIILNSELFYLKIGLALLTGGILGNVIDRALHGGTLDFIPLSLPFFSKILFNPADLFQWIGAVIIAIKIIISDKIIWYPDNQRGFALVNKKEQMKFALKFSLISLSTCLVLGLFGISYMTLTLQSMGVESKTAVIAYAINLLVITCLFIIFSLFAGLILSQRTAGPLFAFEKYVTDLLAGEDRVFKLRENDNYKHLESIAESLRKYFKK